MYSDVDWTPNPFPPLPTPSLNILSEADSLLCLTPEKSFKDHQPNSSNSTSKASVGDKTEVNNVLNSIFSVEQSVVNKDCQKNKLKNRNFKNRVNDTPCLANSGVQKENFMHSASDNSYLKRINSCSSIMVPQLPEIEKEKRHVSFGGFEIFPSQAAGTGGHIIQERSNSLSSNLEKTSRSTENRTFVNKPMATTKAVNKSNMNYCSTQESVPLIQNELGAPKPNSSIKVVQEMEKLQRDGNVDDALSQKLRSSDKNGHTMEDKVQAAFKVNVPFEVQIFRDLVGIGVPEEKQERLAYSKRAKPPPPRLRDPEPEFEAIIPKDLVKEICVPIEPILPKLEPLDLAPPGHAFKLYQNFIQRTQIY
ncbi:uncharacterized protein LOC106471634 [Limulus polyphemus]|uniref:Uncharacterized protein LOC106471634 n=1 Tax=Limulus polyphemus TaxID=6850 RepID=A0ABM1BSB1_LIMPO|nr:uncharacterized protein LOC106471634 [Limulus polyphemus]